jgi:hypothetical protein
VEPSEATVPEVKYTGLKIRASDVHQVAPFCKALQVNYLAFKVFAPNCANERGHDADPALDPALALALRIAPSP